MYLHRSNYLYILGKLQQDKFWASHLSANITNLLTLCFSSYHNNNAKVHKNTEMTQKVTYPHTHVVVKTLKIEMELLENLLDDLKIDLLLSV